MNYSDFKPASISYELLGVESDERNIKELDSSSTESSVKVIIYRNIDMATVKKTYPTFGGKPAYHFIEYGEAITFLEKQISELKAEEKDEDLGSAKLRKQLISECEQTRAKITERLGT